MDGGAGERGNVARAKNTNHDGRRGAPDEIDWGVVRGGYTSVYTCTQGVVARETSFFSFYFYYFFVLTTTAGTKKAAVCAAK